MLTEAQRLQEEALLLKIAEVEREQKGIRSKVSQAKKALTDAESLLIETNLIRDRLLEELRIWRHRNLDHKSLEREEDIERFRKILPDLDPETWEILLAQREKK
jgi:hypothetical protein